MPLTTAHLTYSQRKLWKYLTMFSPKLWLDTGCLVGHMYGTFSTSQASKNRYGYEEDIWNWWFMINQKSQQCVWNPSQQWRVCLNSESESHTCPVLGCVLLLVHSVIDEGLIGSDVGDIYFRFHNIRLIKQTWMEVGFILCLRSIAFPQWTQGLFSPFSFFICHWTKAERQR